MKFKPQAMVATATGFALVAYLLLKLWPEGSEAHTAKPVPAIASAPSPALPTPVEPPSARARATSAKATQPPPATPAPPPKQRYAKITIKAGQPIPELFPHQAERDRLLTLATTYDVKNIPLIAPSLTHSDATVREAARQALIQIGDAAAIPYLQAASQTTRDPAEADALRETIEFLSLPHFMDVVTLGANAPKTTP